MKKAQTNSNNPSINKQRGKNMGLSGNDFEKRIEIANAVYSIEGKGLIMKIPTGTKAIPTAKGVRWVPSRKTGCDFMGVFKGVPIAFEAKTMNSKTNFTIEPRKGQPMVKPHQMQFLKKFEKSGGHAFILIELRGAQETYLVDVNDYDSLVEQAKVKNRKSISIKDLRPFQVSLQNYLKLWEE